MLHYYKCPLTISSECEPWRLEAWRRLNPGLTNIDLYYRMPPEYQELNGVSLENKKLFGLTSMTNKMWRWRPKGSCIAWNKRKGSNVVSDFISSKLSAQDKQDNSTRNFRDLRHDELAELKRLVEADKLLQKAKKNGTSQAGKLVEDDPKAGGENTLENAHDQDDQALLDSPIESGDRTSGQPLLGKRGREHDKDDGEIQVDTRPAKRRTLKAVPSPAHASTLWESRTAHHHSGFRDLR